MFKILNGYENVDYNILFEIKESILTRGHNFTLVKKQSRLDVRKFSFSQRTINVWNKLSAECVHASSVNLFIYYLLCHIYPGIPHQCATLFSLGLLHYIHDNTNNNQYTFSSNTVITWYMYMLTTYSYTCFSLNITMVTWPWCRFIEMLTTYNYLIHVWSTYAYLPRM